MKDDTIYDNEVYTGRIKLIQKYFNKKKQKINF